MKTFSADQSKDVNVGVGVGLLTQSPAVGTICSEGLAPRLGQSGCSVTDTPCLSLRFVASCGFTPDVKVWEVCFGKNGDFREVARAFELKGHTAGVHSFSFSNDSRR